MLLALRVSPARAQDVPPEIQLEPETQAVEPSESALDLRNLVSDTAKRETSVQEAPAIVTVVTADDIRRFGYRTLQDLLSDIPGWYRYDAQGEDIPYVTVRGGLQSVLVMRDGVSMFDPFGNVTTFNRSIPLESIKRVEVVTGPGGVLWGANSFLGVANIISKDADDVDGVEAQVGYGDGRGDRQDFRAWAMVGQRLLGGRVKAFAHVSFEDYVGQELTVRQFLVESPAPQPNGLVSYGGQSTSNAQPSWLLNFDGKVSTGPLSLFWLYSDGRMRWPATFTLGTIAPNPAYDPTGITSNHSFTRFDRLVALQYRDNFNDGQFHVDAKAFATQMVWRFQDFVVFPASQLLPGGLTLDADPTPWRAGATVDATVMLPASNQLLFGGEAFREWTDGANIRLLNPGPKSLPFLCPHNGGTTYVPQCPVPLVFPASREVGAAFVVDRWAPHRLVSFDAGARLQAGFGERPYDPVTLLSASFVWQFAPAWHLKLNYAEGFRPPVFNNTDSNGDAIQYGGNRYIKNEFSRAGQSEINARLLRNVRKVRELTLRADYSYNVLDQTIVIENGHYLNGGQRGMSSAEFLARLELKGDHSIQLGYTYLSVVDQLTGFIRTAPNHWFTVQSTFGLIREHMELVNTLTFAGAAEDPNRLPRPSEIGADARTSDLAFDRVPAVGLWNVGLRVKNVPFGPGHAEIEAFAYNVLDQHWYQQDPLNDLSPYIEHQPYPGFGRSITGRLTVHY
jgi:outer membrane receptor protein involved in Fe transport